MRRKSQEVAPREAVGRGEDALGAPEPVALRRCGAIRSGARCPRGGRGARPWARAALTTRPRGPLGSRRSRDRRRGRRRAARRPRVGGAVLVAGVDDRQRPRRGRPRSPGAATSVRPTAWSIASSSRRRPPPRSMTDEADGAHVDAGHDAGALGRASTVTGAAGRWSSGRSSRSRAAERGDHAREALGRRAGRRSAARGSPSRPLEAGAARSRERERDLEQRGSSLAAPVRWSIDSRTSTALPAVRPSTWSMSVSSATVGRPAPSATSTMRSRQLARPRALGHERARAELDVHHQRVEPGGELLGQDRGDDQRDRLDRAGGVADRVQAAVGGGEVGGLADDRAARLARRRGGKAVAVGRRRRSRGSRRACRACRRCGRGRGRRSSAPRRRRRRRSARASARPCRRRRRSSACRAPGGRGPSSRTVPESRIAPVSATRSSASIPRKKTAIANAADLRVGDRAVGDPGDEEVDLLGAQGRAVALAADDLLARKHHASLPTKASSNGRRGRGGTPPRRVQRLLVAERLVAHPLGEVGDRRDRGDAQAGVAGDDHLGDRRHADRVGAQRAERADLGRRLEARAATAR